MAETTLRETIRKFDEVKQEVRTSEEAWAAFLTCAARNHKYVFQFLYCLTAKWFGLLLSNAKKR